MTPYPARVPGRSVADVARAMRSSERRALLMLQQLERDGLAEENEDGWRLTDEAERLYGPALRLMDEWLDELREGIARAA